MGKRIICIWIVFVMIFFIGCQKTETSTKKTIEKPIINVVQTSPSDNQLVEAPDENSISSFDKTLNIYYPGGSHIYDIYDIDQLTIEKWENQVRGISGMSIDYSFYINTFPLSFLSNITKEGLIYINDYETLKYLKIRNAIIPLNEYVSEIKGFNVIDNTSIAAFSDDDGTLWAIPTYERTYYTGTMSYNKSWLEILETPVPETLDEYLDLARKIREQNNLLNSDKKTYINVISSFKVFLLNYSNFFVANGCYPSTNWFMTHVSYNIENNQYEDIVFNDGFKETLEYVKFMIDEDLILDASSMPIGSYSINNEIASEFYLTGEDSVKGYYLKGSSKEKLIYANVNVMGFAILRDTSYVKEKISFIVDEVFSSEALLATFNYGVEDYHYYKDGNYYITINNAQDKFRRFTSMKIAYENDINVYSPLILSINPPNKYQEITESIVTRYENKISIYNDYKENTNLLYPYMQQKEVIYLPSETTNNYEKAFQNLIDDVFKKEIDIDLAIEKYKESYYNEGYSNYVDSLNQY